MLQRTNFCLGKIIILKFILGMIFLVTLFIILKTSLKYEIAKLIFKLKQSRQTNRLLRHTLKIQKNSNNKMLAKEFSALINFKVWQRSNFLPFDISKHEFKNYRHMVSLQSVNNSAVIRRDENYFILNVPTPATTNTCEKCPSSIQCRDLNPLPSERNSLPITTRPGHGTKILISRLFM